MSHDHNHDNEHDHEEKGIALRVKALEQILIEKNVVNAEALDEIVDIYETRIGPRNGAAVVAKAWSDPEYKARLLANGAAAAAELGFSGFDGEHLVAVENTDDVHNVVVCTLCSCYPWPVLGLPPTWYKSPAYRARIVREPRKVLEEFGTQVPNEKPIKVWDSTADMRYLVIPQRPSGTSDLSQEQLAELVTRDGMVGTALV
jgi:nitrile hydratase